MRPGGARIILSVSAACGLLAGASISIDHAAAHSAVVAMVPVHVTPFEAQKKSIDDFRKDAADIFKPNAFSMSSSSRLRSFNSNRHF